MIVLKCEQTKVKFETEIKNCGPQPRFKDYTIGIDGWELAKYHPCYWKFNLVNFNSKTFSYGNNSWTPLEPSIKIETLKLVKAFNHSVDNSLSYINLFNPAYERALTSPVNVLADIFAVMNENHLSPEGANHISQVIMDQNGKHVLTFVTDWFSSFQASFTAFTAILILIFGCFICGLHRIVFNCVRNCCG